MVWPTLGSRTAEEQNRRESNLLLLVVLNVDVTVGLARLSSQDDSHAGETKSRLSADVSVVRPAAESHRL